MLILASILLSRSSNTSDPLSPIPDAVFSSSFPRDADSTPPCPRQRIQIIWTCVATILAASWVSVHPNIPNAKESWIKKILLRIELMLWAILTPELIIFWAMRQWHGARRMEKLFSELQRLDTEIYQLRHLRESKDEELTPLRKFKWTKTHGFFLQMGGFMLHEEGREDRVLELQPFLENYRQLDLSGVTEARINDHSKADWFAKGLALLQMFWFIAQCIARFFDKSLVLTELELATAALALLSLVMYFLWWNKPFNVGVPITISFLPAGKDPQSKDDANSRPEPVADSINILPPIADAVDPLIPHAQPVEVTQPSDYSVNEAIPSVETNPHLRQSDPVNPPASHLGSAEVSDIAFSQMLPALPPSPQSVHGRVQFVSGLQPTDRAPRPPTRIESDKSSGGFQLWFLFRRIEEILSSGDVGSINRSDHLAVTSVPSFYAIMGNSTITVDLAMFLTNFFAAALFGSIHCIGWSSKIVFASHAASLAWRIASAVITADPVVWCTASVFAYARAKCKHGSMLSRIYYYMAMPFVVVTVVTIPVYIIARLALLVLALVELRHIPPGALANIQWANVLPFIH
ncbi:hypothetical protein CPC08DRAFT_820979 [Agrocybe pediades]|nr:hypothetical protein CPC08DRAFT_820979 [Agrocybe pediades]